jgi:uncharacterized membrane protein
MMTNETELAYLVLAIVLMLIVTLVATKMDSRRR